MINSDIFGVGAAGAPSRWVGATTAKAAHAAAPAARLASAKHRAAATDASVNRGPT
ncbi:hypothetical protein [Mycobacterium bourgelatii]|uniref:Uncharacterized protein n=1 Tax=Mycobacterium bourgelatii TaxID=1273442 RepID=A0A7I9YKI8_MYCBU|nr:hypothetical protein [Mycobacterium bourgelatii]MCV6973407.1 hypothetical protein [Mycobacterium bourgelatii]GFG89023.1 hypothetical protein MBOU_10650 [Mycobacterium bourgelatii]